MLNQDYTVGWICAISTEFTAAKAFLDEKHDQPVEVAERDNNVYALGKIGDHNVVIAVLPDGEYGTNSAASLARDMLHSFPNVRIGLMVGIGGGAPSSRHDVRLGDIVVSSPRDGKGGVIQYDFGKAIQDREFLETGFLDQPPTILRTAIAALKSTYEADGHQIENNISEILRSKGRLRKKYSRPPVVSDRLYISEYSRQNTDKDCSQLCGKDASMLVSRRPRNPEDSEDDVTIHYGLIASANRLMKDARVRDKFAEERGVLCFEMEAAGLMNHFPCLVIRGICDYADSHKNKEWQGFAAMAAAAYAKDLLREIPLTKIEAETRIYDLISSVAKDVQETKVSINRANGAIRQAILQKRQDDICRWLCPPNPSTNLNKGLSVRHRDSGLWFLQSTAYQSWHEKLDSFLWLCGKPGSGKTVLSSTIIEDQHKMAALEHALLYFYFDFRDTAKQSLDQMVRSLIYQLYCQKPGVRKNVESLYSTCQNGTSQPSTDSLCAIFPDMLELTGNVRIVLDALDECTTRKELVLWIQDMCTSKKEVSILATSRAEQDIDSSFKTWMNYDDVIPLQSDLVSPDIYRYIQYRVRSHEALSRWKDHPVVQDEIQQALMQKADGMFRWVACQLDALEDCLNYPALHRALSALPATLDETYIRMISKIPPENLHYTKRLLQFLVYSKRPLFIEEAVDAIAVEIDERPRFNPSYRMPVAGEISRYCPGLIEIHQSIDRKTDDIVTEVQLSHFSVKEWLMSDRLMLSHPTNFSVDFSSSTANAAVAMVCIAYLLELKYMPIYELRRKYPFAKYAAQYWSVHAAIGEESTELVVDMALELLSSKDHFSISIDLHYPSSLKHYEPRFKLPSALYFASGQGLFRASQKLIQRGASVDRVGGDHGTALHVASLEGHEAIIKLLLDQGADPNVPGRHSFCNALQMAISRRHDAIIPLLLEKCADIHTPGSPLGSAIQIASAIGSKTVVKLLLKAGADVNANHGTEHGTPIQAASLAGHEDVVRLLLDNGANVNLRHTYGRYSALQWAIDGEHKAIANMLLHGAGPFLNEVDDSITLQAASYSRQTAFVRFLLEKYVDVNDSAGGHAQNIQRLIKKIDDVNVRRKSFDDALKAALRAGHITRVSLLLEVDSQINMQGQGCYQGNCLTIAISKASLEGYRDIVQLLLDEHARIKAPGEEGLEDALASTSRGGYKAIVKLLLRHGVDADCLNLHGERRNTLQEASFGSHEGTVRLLLENGARVDAPGPHFGRRNALYQASRRGHEPIVRILLENGADVNAQETFIGSALMIASRKDHENGADANAQETFVGSALIIASRKDHEYIVRTLFENGADVNAQEGEGFKMIRALIFASYEGHQSIVSILLENGADVNLQDTRYSNGSALMVALGAKAMSLLSFCYSTRVHMLIRSLFMALVQHFW